MCSSTARDLPLMREEPLNEAMLARFTERAPQYDAENRFFTEDFEELRSSGYLLLAVPEELGGAGYSLAKVVREQRRLGYHAPSTALAVNMHLYWTGIAADLLRSGDSSLKWLLQEGARGAVFGVDFQDFTEQGDGPIILAELGVHLCQV